MTTNQQRAFECWADSDPVASIAAALDEAEARGRDEVAAKIERLADHITALDVSTVKAPGLVDRLRAIVKAAGLAEDES